MYAIIIKESEYPCGNVFGIFDNLEKSNEVVKNMTTSNEEISIEIIEFELNKIIEGSLTGCADCMSCIKLLKHDNPV